MAEGGIIRGKRVFLRHPRPEDARRFLEFVRANRDYHRPWVYPPADGDTFRRFAARCDSEGDQGFLVFDRESGELVGVVDLSQIIRGPLQSAFLGYYGSAGFEGRGAMSEAVRLVVRHAFNTLRLHRVEANIQPDNVASIRLVERCGFRKEGLSPRYLKIGGRWRDHERWAVLAD